MITTSDCVVGAEKLIFLRLPPDLIKNILLFLPASFVLRTVAVISSYFACIPQSEEYWKRLWVSRLTVCLLKYIQPVMQPTLSSSSSCRTGLPPVVVPRSSCVLPLASVSKERLPRIGSLEADSCLAVVERCDDAGRCVIDIGLKVEPLRLLFFAGSDATVLAYHIAETCTMQGWDVSSDGPGGETKGHDKLRLRKTLCFLESSKFHGGMTAERPMIDGIDKVRISVNSHTLPPPHHRDVTATEREAALVEFIGCLIYAWERCHPSSFSGSADRRLSLPLEGTWTSPFFFMGGEETEEAAEAGEMSDAVFFPVTYTTSFSSSLSSTLTPLSPPLHHSAHVFVATDGAETNRCLRYSFADTLVYLYLLHHISFSDIHELVWNDERKCAICSRMVSPAGRAVEFRFFVASLFGTYPRFYVKMIFVEGNLPFTHIQEAFDKKSYVNTGALSSSGDVLPELITLFYGGLGRVEVDIPPTILRDGFEKLRNTLGLAPTFPMRLLWNAVMLATGIGGSILQEQQAYFSLYYQSSFTKAFDKIFEST